MSTTTDRFAPIIRAIDQLRADAALAIRISERHGRHSDREAQVCNTMIARALGISLIAAELEGNADDPASRLLARIVVAEHATTLARNASPLPLDSVTAYVHAAAHLMEMAGEEFIATPSGPGRG